MKKKKKKYLLAGGAGLLVELERTGYDVRARPRYPLRLPKVDKLVPHTYRVNFRKACEVPSGSPKLTSYYHTPDMSALAQPAAYPPAAQS